MDIIRIQAQGILAHNVMPNFHRRMSSFKHRFQEHPFHRPTLLLRGEELPSSRKTITREISAEDVVVAGAIKFS